VVLLTPCRDSNGVNQGSSRSHLWQKYKMKQLIQLVISQLVMQVYSNSYDQHYLFSQPQFFSKGASHPWVLGGNSEQVHVSHVSHHQQVHVSHVSHHLPGKSSMTITRQYKQNNNNTAIPVSGLHSSSYFSHLNNDLLAGQIRAGDTTEETTLRTEVTEGNRGGHVVIDSIHDGIPTSDVIRTNLSKNQHSVDHSHPIQEEMINHQSPMLTRAESSTGTPGPFAPRFQVPRWEISDSEWEEEIKEGFVNSGLVPGVLPSYPPGLVNINYGVHGCVHLGTHMKAVTTATPPTRLSYPTEHGRIYSIILLDVASMSVLWLVVNIPGSALPSGQTIAEYQPPTPLHGTHSQYLIIAMLQSRVINKASLQSYQARLCEYGPRRLFNLGYFMAKTGLEVIVAANYFTVEHDSYVDSINQYCNNAM